MQRGETLTAVPGSTVVLDDDAAKAVVRLRETHGDCLFVSYLLNLEALAADVVRGAPALGVAVTCPVSSMLGLLHELHDEEPGSALKVRQLSLVEGGDRVPGRVCLALTGGTTVVLSAVPLLSGRRVT